jgi:uncharacterized membrane protein YcaP (DUF421 family)
MWSISLTGVLEVVGRTAIVYVCLLFGLRLSGKREIGQLTPFDLAVLLLISNALQNAMTGGDNSVTAGLISAGVLLGLNVAVAGVRMRWPNLRKFVEGSPVVLVSHGEVQHRNLAREQLTYEELLMSLRQHEVQSEKEVELAMLEVDGSITVIRRIPDSSDGFHHSRKKLVRHHKRSS